MKTEFASRILFKILLALPLAFALGENTTMAPAPPACTNACCMRFDHKYATGDHPCRRFAVAVCTLCPGPGNNSLCVTAGCAGGTCTPTTYANWFYIGDYCDPLCDLTVAVVVEATRQTGEDSNYTTLNQDRCL